MGLARRFDVAELLARTPEGYVVEGTPPAVGIDPEALATFWMHMDDDLDTPGALAGIFKASLRHIPRRTRATRGGRTAGAERRGAGRPLGLSLRAADTDVDPESARLVAERDEARRAKDFARADALRDELVDRGWTVEDTASGTAIRR